MLSIFRLHDVDMVFVNWHWKLIASPRTTRSVDDYSQQWIGFFFISAESVGGETSSEPPVLQILYVGVQVTIRNQNFQERIGVKYSSYLDYLCSFFWYGKEVNERNFHRKLLKSPEKLLHNDSAKTMTNKYDFAMFCEHPVPGELAV